MTETSGPEPYVITAAAPANGGLAAVIFAGIVVLLGLVSQAVGQMLPRIMEWLDLRVEEVWLVFLPLQLATMIAAVLAIVLAIRPLRGGSQQALAGAAAGIGTTALLSILVGFALASLSWLQ